MKVLWLGTSDDANERIPEHLRVISIAAKAFTEETGVPIDPEFRMIWPAPRFPELVRGWLEQYEPEMVVVHVNPYWFTYESVPAKLKRLFGPVGRVAAAAGLRAAATPRLSENVAFRTGRRFAVRTLGGDVAVNAEECVAMMDSLVSGIVTRESTVVLVQGPHRPNDASGTEAGYRRAAEACRLVSDGIELACERMHVTYWKREIAKRAGEDVVSGDGVHITAEEHAVLGREEAAWMAKAWKRAHAMEQE